MCVIIPSKRTRTRSAGRGACTHSFRRFWSSQDITYWQAITTDAFCVSQIHILDFSIKETAMHLPLPPRKPIKPVGCGWIQNRQTILLAVVLASAWLATCSAFADQVDSAAGSKTAV